MKIQLYEVYILRTSSPILVESVYPMSTTVDILTCDEDVAIEVWMVYSRRDRSATSMDV